MSGCSRRSWILAIIALSVTSLALFSCGPGSGGSKSDGLTIAVIPKGTTHEFWKSIHAGALKAQADLAAQKVQVEIIWKGPQKEDDREQQITLVEDIVNRGVSGIVLAPLDDKALVRPVKDSTAESIPVVIIDSGLASDDYVSFVATDNHKGGALAARRLAEILGGKGTAIMLRYQEGSDSTMRREKGFTETLAAEFPGITLVSAEQYGGATTETSYQKAESLLQSYPNVGGIFCPNESTTFGMLRALQDAGRAGKVRFVGFDASPKLVEALGAKQIHGLVLQDPFRMGHDGVMTVVAHLQGKKVEKRIDTGVTMVTPENMNEPKLRELHSPDLTKWLR